MKTNIHPNLKLTKVTCTGCGNEFETLSIKETITVNVCNNCHPFFTGTKKILDSEGRVEIFERIYKLAQEQKEKKEQQKKEEQEKQKKKKELFDKAKK